MSIQKSPHQQIATEKKEYDAAQKDKARYASQSNIPMPDLTGLTFGEMLWELEDVELALSDNRKLALKSSACDKCGRTGMWSDEIIKQLQRRRAAVKAIKNWMQKWHREECKNPECVMCARMKAADPTPLFGEVPV